MIGSGEKFFIGKTILTNLTVFGNANKTIIRQY